MESENDTNGIYNIMHHLHKYVPGHGTEKVTPVISAGDLLTCERESSFRGEQRNSTTHSEKLKGIVPVIADFHALANFYQVGLPNPQGKHMYRFLLYFIIFNFFFWRGGVCLSLNFLTE